MSNLKQNSKVKVVSEYEKLVRELDDYVSYSYDAYKTIGKKDFDDLRLFLESNSIYDLNKEPINMTDFYNISYYRNYGQVISFKNYVGCIRLPSGLQIEILPKIYNKENNENKVKKYFIEMLRSSIDSACKTSTEALLTKTNMSIFETYILLFILEVEEILKKGLVGCYQTKEDNLNFLKGKLLIEKNIKINLFNKSKFYSNFDQFDFNSPENKIIKTCLIFLLGVTSNIENKTRIIKLLTSFEFVEESTNIIDDIYKISFSRLNNYYFQGIELAKIFLSNQSFSPFQGSNKTVAILFDMNKLFEMYVAKQIKKKYSNKYSVILQDSNRCYLSDNPQKFMLKPDIVVKDRHKALYILDTKRKILSNDSSKNFNISQNDMYQMFVYSVKYKCDSVYLIYPYVENLAQQNLLFKCNVDQLFQPQIKIVFWDFDDGINSLKL